jgi:hypothetical protein
MTDPTPPTPSTPSEPAIPQEQPNPAFQPEVPAGVPIEQPTFDPTPAPGDWRPHD